MGPRRVCVYAALALLAGCGKPSPKPDAPDVVVISIDSLRPDHLACYGYPVATSPTIDRLAAEGVRFTQAVSTTSWTLPAHAALFTGLYDSGHGLIDNGLRLSDSQVTLAEVFARNGWRTAGFFGGPYLHPVFGVAQGFETYQSCMTQLDDDLSEEQVREQSRSRLGESRADVTGPRTLEEVERWLAGIDDKPCFLFVHLWDVHYDYIAPQKYVDMFDPDYTGTLSGVDFMENPAISPKMDPRDYQHLMALYDAEIRFTDDILAGLLAALEKRGRMDRTLLVLTADHGEEFLEHGRKGHQRTLYDEVVRIPLLFHWPGKLAAAPGVVEDQVRIVDIAPTLLSLCGIDDVPDMNGRDLSDLLQGRTLAAHPALCELYADGRDAQALRTTSFKVIKAGPSHPGAGFDLGVDPHEQTTLTADQPRVQSAIELLGREHSAARKLGAGRGPEPAADLDPLVLERLRSLGYLGDAGQGRHKR